MGVTSLYDKTSKRWLCKICDLTFSSAMGRLQHLRATHSEFLKHSCSECGIKCETQSAIRSHLERQHRHQTTAQNDDSFNVSQRLRKRVKCRYCSMCFINELLHMQHVQLNHPKALASFNESANQKSESESTLTTACPTQKGDNLSQDSLSFLSSCVSNSTNKANLVKYYRNPKSNNKRLNVSSQRQKKIEMACLQYALLHGKHKAQLHYAKIEPGCRLGWRRITELLENRDKSNTTIYTQKLYVPPSIASNCGQYGSVYGIDEAQWEFTLRYPRYVFPYRAVRKWYSAEKRKHTFAADISEKYFDKQFSLSLDGFLRDVDPNSINTVESVIKSYVAQYNKDVGVGGQVLGRNVVDEWLHSINSQLVERNKGQPFRCPCGNIYVTGKYMTKHWNTCEMNNFQEKDNTSSYYLNLLETAPKISSHKEFISSLSQVLKTKRLSVRDTEKLIQHYVGLFNKNCLLGEHICDKNILDEWLHFFNTKTAKSKTGNTLSSKLSETKQREPSMKDFILNLNVALKADIISVRDMEAIVKKHVVSFNKKVSNDKQISYQNILIEWLHFLNIEAKNRAKVGHNNVLVNNGNISSEIIKAPRKRRRRTYESALNEFMANLNDVLRSENFSARDVQTIIKVHVISFNQRFSKDDQISYQNVLEEWLYMMNFIASKNCLKDNKDCTCITVHNVSEAHKKKQKTNTFSAKRVLKRKNNKDHPPCSKLKRGSVGVEKSTYLNSPYATIIVEKCVSKVNWEVVIEDVSDHDEY